jgi:putative spermidine/putrescine transport system ATP-binding protein
MKLQLAGVTKRYPDVTAVEDLSFGVSEGEFLTLLGPSGSGKTTTLMLIAGFIAPDQGRVFLNGRDVTNLPEFKRNIGVVFQNYALFPHMTVQQNVAFPLRMRHVPKAETAEKVTSALNTVGLHIHHNRYPRQLSGGQQQRVALARALVFDPPVLLMDEPLGSLDRKLRDQMQIEFKRIQRELKATVVYVTHDQEEALAMSDRVALMRRGRIEQIGTASDLYERPASRSVAEFIGEANCLDGTIVAVNPNEVAINVGGKRMIRGTRADFAVRSAVTAVVRPERVRIAAGADHATNGHGQSSDDNRLSGIIIEEIYAGSTVRYTIALDDGLGSFLVRHVKQRESNERHLGRGDHVVLHWRPDDTIVTEPREDES